MEFNTKIFWVLCKFYVDHIWMSKDKVMYTVCKNMQTSYLNRIV